jgi:ribulose-5-phosphate 4-epimerase/fuculose-1-phosphate aldolase
MRRFAAALRLRGGTGQPELRRGIIEVVRQLVASGLVSVPSGNVSARNWDNECMLITPSAVDIGF